MAVIVACVEPGTAHQVWPRVADMIEVGYAAGDDFMPDDILERIRYGKLLLWIAIDDVNGEIYAAMTTELVRMRSGLVCWMCQCGGDRMIDWSRFHTEIEEYAKKEGCVKVALRGRAGARGQCGWERVLGYKVRTVQLEKTL